MSSGAEKGRGLRLYLFGISRHDGEDSFGDELGEEVFGAVLLGGEGGSEGEDEGFGGEGSFESFDGEF